MEELRRASIHPEVLAEVLSQPEADAFDFLAHLAFGAPVRTRSERAEAFRNREQAFVDRHREEVRRVILELLEKYRVGGIDQLEPEIFGVAPFRDWGGATRISQWFGSPAALGRALNEMRHGHMLIAQLHGRTLVEAARQIIRVSQKHGLLKIHPKELVADEPTFASSANAFEFIAGHSVWLPI